MPKYQVEGRVVWRGEECEGICRIRVEAPQIASDAIPGQFVHVSVASEPPTQFLRMPFAVCQTSEIDGTVDVVFAVVGEGTRQLASLGEGDLVSLLGPVGNGWQVPQDARNVLLVAGGVGAPALNMLADRMTRIGVRVSAVLGARTAGTFACRETIAGAVDASGGELFITTDDGTEGLHGFVTAASDDLIASGAYDYVAVCGPTPMMRNVARPALEHGVSCQVSMEKLMACGVGACLSCVVETTQGRKRCCVDGPVFDASEVIW